MAGALITSDGAVIIVHLGGSNLNGNAFILKHQTGSDHCDPPSRSTQEETASLAACLVAPFD